jgi:Spy/CpxP family protein refolding chaperone
MKRTTLLSLIAITGFVFLSVTGVTPSVAEPDGPAPAQELDSPQPPAPDETTPAPHEWKCPKCGNSSPMQYGRRGERKYRGRDGKHGHGAPSSCRGMGRDTRGPGEGRGKGLPADRFLRGATHLELTEDQVADLEKLSYDTRLQLIDLESDLEKAQLEMKRLMQDGSDDISAVKKQLRSLSEKKLGIQEIKLENLFEAKKILTDDQKQKIRATHPRMGGML